MSARAPSGHRTRTGLLPEHRAVAAPEYEVRLTIPARERLLALGNEIAPFAASSLGDLYSIDRVTLTGRVPAGLVFCLVGHGDEQHPALRCADEPEYPGEWPAEAVAWHERGAWVPCPACGAPLVWLFCLLLPVYESAYVPGYRVCAESPHHHATLSGDGRSATLVSRPVVR